VEEGIEQLELYFDGCRLASLPSTINLYKIMSDNQRSTIENNSHMKISKQIQKII